MLGLGVSLSNLNHLNTLNKCLCSASCRTRLLRCLWAATSVNSGFVALDSSRCVTTWSPLASEFNSTLTKKLKFNLLADKTGLFGNAPLQDPNGFYLFKEWAVSEAENLLQEALSFQRKRKLVQIFDDLSDTLCKVADLAEFVRIGHPQKQFTVAAEDATLAISGLVEKLNTNRELFNTLSEVVTNGDRVPTDDVDNHVAKLFLFDFEQSGIHLDEMKREKVVQLNQYILHVGSYFMNGTTNSRRIKISQLPESIQNCFTVDGDCIVVPGLFADSEKELVREAAYKIYLYPDAHQGNLLDELLNARNDLALLCDFPTYAHRAVRGSVAGSPEMINEFLNVLNGELKPRVSKEYDEILAIKRSHSKLAKELMPWDVPYFTSVAKKERFHTQIADYSPYFSLGACMEGLNELFQSLYGVTLETAEVKDGEAWCSDIIKLAVKEDNVILGYIYCDFFEREGKTFQDCHFTIQGGRQLPAGTYQMPIVVLMLNLPSPSLTTPTLLSPSMVDNLFHEMGHAMHSMLARTTYQHVAGTRCSTDLAEVPSILMEYFASDPRVIKRFAKHYKTGAPLPEHLLKNFRASKRLFAASDTQMQVFYSVLDQRLHGYHPLPKTTTELLADIQEQYYRLPYVPNTAWHLRFGHLVGYGAKYYAYLMSRAIASWIWQSYFRDDPYSSEAGARYRKNVLAHGGSKPPCDLIEDYMQQKVSPQTLASFVVRDIDEGL